jgi:hypothetical protein
VHCFWTEKTCHLFYACAPLYVESVGQVTCLDNFTGPWIDRKCAHDYLHPGPSSAPVLSIFRIFWAGWYIDEILNFELVLWREKTFVSLCRGHMWITEVKEQTIAAKILPQWPSTMYNWLSFECGVNLWIWYHSHNYNVFQCQKGD